MPETNGRIKVQPFWIQVVTPILLAVATYYVGWYRAVDTDARNNAKEISAIRADLEKDVGALRVDIGGLTIRLGDFEERIGDIKDLLHVAPTPPRKPDWVEDPKEQFVPGRQR